MSSLVIIFLITAFFVSQCISIETLQRYNVDKNQTSVSGFSSGGFMSVQVQVSYSSIIIGAGIVAGGPYDCGEEMPIISCMFYSCPPVSGSIAITTNRSGILIDDKSNMAKQRVYMLSGTLDPIVSTTVMNQLYKYYVTDGHFIPASNIVYKTNLISSHTMPTDFNSPGNSACALPLPPWVSNCNFDAAGAILKQIYGNLNPRNNGPNNGTFIEFNQSDLVSSGSALSNGLADSGWVYVPNSCAAGQKCRLHIVFHGCSQPVALIGQQFVRNTGYDKWADTNNFIVVFPQTSPAPSPQQPLSFASFYTLPSGVVASALGCWDYVAASGPDYDTRDGNQVSFVKNIIDRICI